MARVYVHNISDMAVKVSGVQVRPGKHIIVELTSVKKKTQNLHGTKLWFGPLPEEMRKPVPVESMGAGVLPMNLEEVRAYLRTRSYRELLHLGTMMVPPFVPREGTPHSVLITRVSRAMFQPKRVLDPETFFFLRRWEKSGSLFVEK